jgi:hypothetical protein
MTFPVIFTMLHKYVTSYLIRNYKIKTIQINKMYLIFVLIYSLSLGNFHTVQIIY